MVKSFMKKILLSFLIYLLLTINSYAETIILKCDKTLYKYVSDGNSVKTYQASSKKSSVWWEWPKTKVQADNKHFLTSINDGEAIIDGYVFTEKWSKIKWSGKTAKNGIIIVDFKNKTYNSKSNINGKAWSKKAKCKLKKS